MTTTYLARLLVVSCSAAWMARPALAEQFQVKSAGEAQAAVGKARPGDEIVLRNGSYHDLQLELTATGEAGKLIVLRAETASGVVLTGEPFLRIGGQYLEIRDLVFRDCGSGAEKQSPIQFDRCGHCRLTGCLFERSRFGGPAVVAFRNAAHDNRLDHCRFSDTRYRTVQVIVDDDSLRNGPPVRNRIDHNLFQDVPSLGKNGAETVQIGQSAIPYADLRPDTVVENNLFLRCSGEFEIISIKTTGNIIRHNIFRDCDGEVVNRTGHENVIDGNLFERCAGGIRISNHGHQITNNVIVNCRGIGIQLYYGTPDTKHPAAYLPVYGCVIANNTIVGCEQTGLLVGGKRNAHYEAQLWAGPPWFASAIMDCTIAPHENRISKNIIVGSKGVLLKLEETPDNAIKGNLFLATGQATVGDTGENSLIVDPGFQNAAAGDYRLAPNSPARAAGIGASAESFPAGPDAK